MKTRTLFVCCALLMLLASGAMAGTYQPTRDTKVLVWNDQPKPGDAVTWSGRKDAEGYATGYGTLTWFAPDKTPETGSNIPSSRHYRIVSRYFGKMSQGKFVDRRKPAAATPTPARNQTAKAVAPHRANGVKERGKTPAPTPVPQRPAPSTPAPTPSASPSPNDDSLNALTHPPSSLQLKSPAESMTPTPSPSP